MSDRTEDISVLRRAAGLAHAEAVTETDVMAELAVWFGAVATCLEVAPRLPKVHALRVARAFLGEAR